MHDYIIDLSKNKGRHRKHIHMNLHESVSRPVLILIVKIIRVGSRFYAGGTGPYHLLRTRRTLQLLSNRKKKTKVD